MEVEVVPEGMDSAAPASVAVHRSAVPASVAPRRAAVWCLNIGSLQRRAQRGILTLPACGASRRPAHTVHASPHPRHAVVANETANTAHMRNTHTVLAL